MKARSSEFTAYLHRIPALLSSEEPSVDDKGFDICLSVACTFSSRPRAAFIWINPLPPCYTFLTLLRLLRWKFAVVARGSRGGPRSALRAPRRRRNEMQATSPLPRPSIFLALRGHQCLVVIPSKHEDDGHARTTRTVPRLREHQ